MTEGELEAFISNCPTLYHMAAHNSSDGILKHGLLSTAALLDLYEVCPEKRVEIERRGSKSITISHDPLPNAVIRDQKPLCDTKLATLLQNGLKPVDWRRILNRKCFFWVCKKQLKVLQNARAYRGKPHDVLEVDTRSLIAAHYGKIRLCHMNSGSTLGKAGPRGENTFAKIDDYPHSSLELTDAPWETVMELTVERAVPDIRKYIKYIERIHVTKRPERFTVNPHLCSQDS